MVISTIIGSDAAFLNGIERMMIDPLEQALADAIAAQGPLSERLRMFAGSLVELAPDYASHYELLTGRLSAAEAGATAPGPGAPMPDFSLPDVDGHIRGLSEFLNEGPLVVSFKRGHWCEFCRIELDGLIRIYPEIRRVGARLVTIYPETASSLAKLRQIVDAPFPMLCDIDSAYALELGLAMSVDPHLREMLERDGIPLAEYQAGNEALLPLPATFVVAPDGRVAARFVSPDFRTRMEPSDVLVALVALSRGCSQV